MNEIRLFARLYATELGHEAVAGFVGEQDGLASIFYTDDRSSLEKRTSVPSPSPRRSMAQQVLVDPINSLLSPAYFRC
jgi:hypothetical protein